MMPGLLPDNISKPHNHTWLNSLCIWKTSHASKKKSKTDITFRIDDVENAHPLYKREWASTRSLQPHVNGTQYSSNFFENNG